MIASPLAQLLMLSSGGGLAPTGRAWLDWSRPIDRQLRRRRARSRRLRGRGQEFTARGLNLFTAVREAQRLGCTVSRVRRTCEIRIVAPDGERFVVSGHRKDIERRFARLLQRLRSAEVPA